MGMGIFNRCRTVGSPPRMANASFTRQRMVHQQIRKVHQLANRAAGVKYAAIHGGDARTVIAAIFHTF